MKQYNLTESTTLLTPAVADYQIHHQLNAGRNISQFELGREFCGKLLSDKRRVLMARVEEGSSNPGPPVISPVALIQGLNASEAGLSMHGNYGDGHDDGGTSDDQREKDGHESHRCQG